MKKDFQDRIDEYVLGRMIDEEKAQFETEVSNDESISEQLEFTRNVKGAISSREEKKSKLKIMKRMYDRKHQQVAASMRATGTDDCQYTPAPQYVEEKKPSRRIWWWVSGIAAVLVIGLFVVNPFGSDTMQTPSGFSPSFKGIPNDMEAYEKYIKKGFSRLHVRKDILVSFRYSDHPFDHPSGHPHQARAWTGPAPHRLRPGCRTPLPHCRRPARKRIPAYGSRGHSSACSPARRSDRAVP